MSKNELNLILKQLNDTNMDEVYFINNMTTENFEQN